MQVANAPLKWLYPWAQLSSSIFELPPTTTAGDGRACQSIGFPPETMLPPESGGVPPQGIDFNAGLYQVARITWWLMYGGPFVYDATFATNSAISGYAQGAEVSSTDYLGKWRSTVDNNQVPPDTTGTGWIPSAAYGSTTIALTNANVTLTPLQASKKTLIFTGTLTGNVVVTLPAWIYDWTVLNNCSGAFTLTLTTSGGSGAVVPQGGAVKLRGDGTNINFDAVNTPSATTANQAATISQVQADAATYAVDTGTANAYIVAYTPTFAALTDGMSLCFRAVNANTGASTLNVNGIGAHTIRNNASQPLVGGEILAGQQITVIWNATNTSFLLQNQQMVGRLIKVTPYTTAGTFTFTPQSSTTTTRVRIAGGGGAGGGTQATGSTAATASAGGNPGGYAEFLIPNFSSGTATVVVGTAGAGSAGNPGGNGAQSSFTTAGSSVVVPGGNGGNAGAAFTTFPDVVNGPGSNAAITSSGGTLLVFSRGGLGFPGIALSTSVVIAGRAGSNPVAGDSDLALSAGGNGTAAGISTAAQAGASGENGFCFVEEYS